VFAAFTTPELVKRWMGPRALAIPICQIDLRVGGRWRMVHRTRPSPAGTAISPGEE
jgi:uncharacterized protein YndB with AHSA1/START domain